MLPVGNLHVQEGAESKRLLGVSGRGHQGVGRAPELEGTAGHRPEVPSPFLLPTLLPPPVSRSSLSPPLTDLDPLPKSKSLPSDS